MRINDYIKHRAGGELQPHPPQPQSQPESNEQMLDRYSRMNEEQLMQEMFRNAADSRANGTLNNEMLDEFYAKAGGYLTPEQSERMKELIRELKK